MEGRHPPPKATHPFPDQVNLSRFFAHKEHFYGFAKFATVFCSLWMGALYAHYWISKDHGYFLGVKLKTAEELIKSIEARKKAYEIRSRHYEIFSPQMEFKMDRFFKEKPNVDGLFEDSSVQYDDEVKYHPGMIVELPPVPDDKAKSETKSQ